MAAPYNPPVKNEDFIIYTAVADMGTPGAFKQNPTVQSGDFMVSKDGGDFASLNTLPTVTPSGYHTIKVTLSNTEMNADNVVIRATDPTSPKEWADLIINIVTTTS